MYFPDSASDSAKALALLSAASPDPAGACGSDPETQEAFEEGLRALAEDIVRYHPGLAHVLMGMGSEPCHFVHGQN
jgi:hypothetical protein